MKVFSKDVRNNFAFDLLQILILGMHGQLEENIKEVENVLKLRNMSKTRWTNRAGSMHAVWTTYEVIMNTFPPFRILGTLTTVQRLLREAFVIK